LFLHDTVKKGLGEPVKSPARGKIYLNKKHYFNLLFQLLEPGSKIPFDVKEDKRQGWTGLLYLKALDQIKVAFDNSESKDGFRVVMEQLESLFMAFCACIPAVSQYSWLAGYGKGGYLPGFIGFDKRNGNRLDDPLRDWSVSSWKLRTRLSHDSCWWLTAEEVLNDDITAFIRQTLVEFLKEYSVSSVRGACVDEEEVFFQDE
jgi:hypothetical protein